MDLLWIRILPPLMVKHVAMGTLRTRSSPTPVRALGMLAARSLLFNGSESLAVCDPHPSNREWPCGVCCCAEEEGWGCEGHLDWLPGQSPWDCGLPPSSCDPLHLSIVALRGTGSSSSRCSQRPSQCQGTRAILQWSILHLCPSRPVGHLCQEGQWL